MNEQRATIPCPSCQQLNRIDLGKLDGRPKCGKCASPIDAAAPIPVSDRSLDGVLSGTTVPVLVDFYADWCGPCKTMAPMFAEFARERAGEAIFAKLQTDENPTATRKHGIGGIPSLVLFHDGREIAREIGAVPKFRLGQLLDRVQPGATSAT